MHRRQFLGSAAAAALCPSAAFSGAHATTTRAQPLPLAAVTADGAGVELSPTHLRELREQLRGPLLLRESSDYDDARRVINAAIDKYPALIVQCSGAADVMTAVDFARAHSLLLAVKSGGHSYGGKSTCDDGMMIDLSRLRGVRVDPARRRAYVDGGSLLGELDHEAMAHGLVTTAGTVSHTGVAGLTLGGGFGRVARRFGLALDNLRAADVVTADGRLRHANADEHPDLLWALRGGGGNFGVVTSFEFQLHPMQRQVIGGHLIYPLDSVRDLLRVYADYSPRQPNELYTDLAVLSPPGSRNGVVRLSFCHSGAARQAEAAISPYRKAGRVLQDTLGTVDYVAYQRSGDDDDPRSLGMYLKSGFMPGAGITEGLIDAIIDGFETDPTRLTLVFFQHAGGAISEVAKDATAFAHRDTTHNFAAAIGWRTGQDPEQHLQWYRAYWDSLRAWTDGFYSNEVSTQGADIIGINYKFNYPRLQKIKAQYDPDNLFRLNANILPRTA